MAHKKSTSTSAKLLYRPIGLVSGLLAGALSGVVFKQIWKRAAPGSASDAPNPLKSDVPLGQILVAAALQGAIYAAIKAAVDRGGARVFEKAVGEWPGD
ncbi:DUF4235 domain-containing protein [Brachybacterium sp. UNK5269]|uniref:DUF4235 domain-containing protein n=1 Tax=Brachybacterium sp. UNK5269 TaxID=3408576 RepID=UPI003BB0E2CA